MIFFRCDGKRASCRTLKRCISTGADHENFANTAVAADDEDGRETACIADFDRP